MSEQQQQQQLTQPLEGIEAIDGEEFVQIPDYPNYWVSNKGRVWNNKRKREMGNTLPNGYIQVGLSHNGRTKFRYIHHLVMENFGEPCPEGCSEIDHKNHIRDDNRIENLRYVSKSDNNKNTSKYRDDVFEHFEKIPCEREEEIIPITEYAGHEFLDLFYCNGEFYINTNVSFKRLHIKSFNNSPQVRVKV